MSVEVINYSPEYKPYFKSLNMEWLNKYFTPTEADLKIIEHPEEIVRDGGEVFFAICDCIVAGTCAIVLHHDNSFDLIKMGVTESMRGKGIAQHLMDKVIETARKKRVNKITLETAKSLVPAVHLYLKNGFVQVGPEELHPMYKRITFKMELNLL